MVVDRDGESLVPQPHPKAISKQSMLREVPVRDSKDLTNTRTSIPRSERV
jgi:hypothetical protein